MFMTVFADVSGHRHSELSSHAMSGLGSTKKHSGNPFLQEAESEEDCRSQAQAAEGPAAQNIHHPPEQSPPISSEATSDSKPPTSSNSKILSHAISPKLKQRLLGLFKKDVDKTDGAPIEEAPKQEEPGSALSQDAAEATSDKPASVKTEVKPSSSVEVRVAVVPQKMPFRETTTSEDVGGDVQAPERMSDLRAFWEKESSDLAKGFTGASRDPKTGCDVENMNNNGCGPLKVAAEAPPDASQTNRSLSVDLSKEDGTYRANPVIIYEETDESLAGSFSDSHICEPQENIISPHPSSVASQTTTREEEIVVPLEVGPVKTALWEESSGSSATTSRVKESSSLHRAISPEVDLKTSSDSRENSEGEGQMSPHKTKPFVVLKTSRVTSKGFVSPDRSPLRSSAAARDPQPARNQYQSSAYTEVQERPLSPRKSPTPRPKEQSDEVRRSPSKTCHPKVLPRETSSPKTSSLEGSPLKTFPINIEPQPEVTEEHRMKPTPVPRQKKSPSHEAKEKTQHSTDFDLPFHPESGGACFSANSSSSSTPPESKRAPEKSPTRLARSYIPQDYQHYLGPQEKAYVPHFYPEKTSAEESDAAHRKQTDGSAEGNLPKITYWVGQSTDGNTSQDKTPSACSLSRASLSSELLTFFFFSPSLFL